jgi:hypothetical protein
MSSDSDFTPLVMRLRQDGLVVYGFGSAKAPEAFRTACTRFIDVDQLIRTEAAEEQEQPAPLETTIDHELIDLLGAAWKAAKRDEEGFASLQEVGQILHDQAELFLLRLLRGAGSEGLGGMKWAVSSPVNPQVRLVRPLLDCPKADLRAFAREAKVRFREDASNASPDILRNRVRRELLPSLKRRWSSNSRSATLTKRCNCFSSL